MPLFLRLACLTAIAMTIGLLPQSAHASNPGVIPGETATQAYLQRQAMRAEADADPTTDAFSAAGDALLPDTPADEQAARLAAIAESPYDRDLWKPIVRADGVSVIALLLDLQATNSLPGARRYGVEAALEYTSTYRIKQIYRWLPETEQGHLDTLLRSANPAASRQIGLNLMDIWTYRGDSRMAFAAGRRLWLSDMARDTVLPRLVTAVRGDADLTREIWANAGTELLAAPDDATRITLIRLHTALATQLGTPQVLRPVLAIADLDDDARADLYLHLLKDGWADTVALLLTTPQTLDEQVIAAWAAAGGIGEPLPHTVWDGIDPQVTSELHAARLGRLLQPVVPARADHYWQRVVDMAPHQTIRDLEARRFLSDNAQKRADFAAAAEHLEQLLAIQDAKHHDNDRMDAARAHLAQLRELAQPENLPFATAMQLAVNALVADDYDTGAAQATIAVELRPDDLDARYRLYSAYRAAENMPAMRDAAEYFRTVHPTTHAQRMIVAIVLMDIGENDRAETYLEQIVSDEPRAPAPYAMLAEIRARQHKPAAGTALIRHAMHLDADGDHADYYHVLAVMEAQAGNWVAAESAAEQYLQRDPADIYGRLALHIIRERQDRDDQDALESFLSYLPPDTMDSWSWNLIQFVAGNFQEKDILRIARDAEPDYQQQNQLCEAYFYIGQKQLIYGETDAARDSFDACVRQNVIPYIEHHWAAAELHRLRQAN